jgi:hypothetical protein
MDAVTVWVGGEWGLNQGGRYVSLQVPSGKKPQLSTGGPSGFVGRFGSNL